MKDKAACGRIVSPKWKTFKGLKLLWRDKIRLNNAIWRAWYLQYVKRQKNPVCNFVTPLEGLENEEHRKPESVVIEGKYWKRRIEIVIREYHIWRTYFRNQLRHKKSNEDLSVLLQEDYYVWPFKTAESATACPMDSDLFFDVDTLMTEFSDTLFSTLIHHPCAWPNSKNIAHFGNADMIQPSLTPLQPNMGDDFMDTFEPLQEYFSPSRPVLGNCNVNGPTGNIFSAGAPIIPAVATIATSGQNLQGTLIPDSTPSLGAYPTAFGVEEQTQMPYALPQNVSRAKAVSTVLSPLDFGTDFETTAIFQENTTFLPTIPTSRVENDAELHIQRSRTTTSTINVNFPSHAPLLTPSVQTSSCSTFDCSGASNCSCTVVPLQCSPGLNSSEKNWLKPQKDSFGETLSQHPKFSKPFGIHRNDSSGVGVKTKQLQRIAPAPNTALIQPLISSVTPVKTQNTFLAQLLMSAPTGPFATLQHHFSRQKKSSPSDKQISEITDFHDGILIGAAQQAGVISDSALPFTPEGCTEMKAEDVTKREKSFIPQSTDLQLQGMLLVVTLLASSLSAEAAWKSKEGEIECFATSNDGISVKERNESSKSEDIIVDHMLELWIGELKASEPVQEGDGRFSNDEKAVELSQKGCDSSHSI
ncbi:MLX-interacting protein-like [Protopterus annectens]|uniref:MLX-interacting protein-like n=1 Tax=Protopterus annectens TaxID=7888 RepID=UPI001CFAE934|nr:MLX-interacting protein-like [Protopterus annectens]